MSEMVDLRFILHLFLGSMTHWQVTIRWNRTGIACSETAPWFWPAVSVRVNQALRFSGFTSKRIEHVLWSRDYGQRV